MNLNEETIKALKIAGLSVIIEQPESKLPAIEKLIDESAQKLQAALQLMDLEIEISKGYHNAAGEIQISTEIKQCFSTIAKLHEKVRKFTNGEDEQDEQEYADQLNDETK